MAMASNDVARGAPLGAWGCSMPCSVHAPRCCSAAAIKLSVRGRQTCCNRASHHSARSALCALQCDASMSCLRLVTSVGILRQSATAAAGSLSDRGIESEGTPRCWPQRLRDNRHVRRRVLYDTGWPQADETNALTGVQLIPAIWPRGRPAKPPTANWMAGRKYLRHYWASTENYILPL